MKKSRLLKVATLSAAQAQKDKSFFEKVKAFFAMLTDYRKGIYRPSIRNLILGIFAALYIISPIDIIPEALFGPFGLIDDFGILMFGMKYLNKEVTKYLAWKATQMVYVDIQDAEIIK